MTSPQPNPSCTFTPSQLPLSRPVGATLLGLNVTTTRDLHQAMEHGLPTQCIESFADTLQVSIRRLLTLLGLKESTYQANRRHGGVIKSGLVNRHLMDMAQTTEAARNSFGDPHAAHRWLTTPSATFDGHTPLEYARYPGGTEYVMAVLARLAHGLYT